MTSLCKFLFLALALPLVSFAKEGFGDPVSSPAVIANAQDSVFIILNAKSDKLISGTSFLVSIHDKAYYFATANHLIKRLCKKDGSCPNVQLYQSASLRFVDGEWDGNLPSNQRHFSKIQVVKQDEQNDFGLIRVEKGSGNLKPLNPLKVSKRKLVKGEKLYTIGFPNVTKRTCARKLPIAQPNLVYKRWSQGIYLGQFQEENGRVLPQIGTTVDVLTGSSGGPLFNQAGEVVGMVIKGAKNCYEGNENADSLSLHSVANLLSM